jgi:cardiolipin synthase
MVIADGDRVFAGGMNVGAEYMGPKAEANHWCDLAFLLAGPAVLTFRDVFRSDWAVTGGDNAVKRSLHMPEIRGTAKVQVVATGPDLPTDPLHDALVHAIHVATDRIWIVTPYFLPTEILSHALTCAARRGIDVRIMLPEKSNQRLADFARGAYLWEMQQAGCKVLFFQDGMIHAKAGILDDDAFVGSANFDVRSMLLNFEIALFVYDAVSVNELVAWYGRREENCVAGVARAGVGRRVLEGVFRLGAPML